MAFKQATVKLGFKGIAALTHASQRCSVIASRPLVPH